MTLFIIYPFISYHIYLIMILLLSRHISSAFNLPKHQHINRIPLFKHDNRYNHALFSSKSTAIPPIHPITVSSIKGRRDYMEDEYIIEGIDTNDEVLGVFDGHSGAQVSAYLKKHLYSKYTSIKKSNNVSLPDALKQALAEIDEEVKEDHFDTGSTSCVVIIERPSSLPSSSASSITGGDDELGYYHTANIGDSRIILSHNKVAIDLTADHKPDSPSERLRIENLPGGVVEWVGDVDKKTGQPILHTGCYRVQGNLALSRSIGDHYMRPYVSSTPDMMTYTIQPEDEFIIAATDGFWDVFSSQDAVNIVHKILDHYKEVASKAADGDKTHVEQAAYIREKIAEILVGTAYKIGSYDNITVILRLLKNI